MTFFDDNQRPVAVVLPTVYDDAAPTTTAAQVDPEQIVAGLLTLLAGDCASPTRAGRRLIITAYLAGAIPGCKTDVALAARLKISAGRVSQIIRDLQRILPSFAKCRRRQRAKS